MRGSTPPPALRIAGLVAAAGLLTASAASAQDHGSDRLVAQAGASRAKGVTGAPVLVFEIADFQCPYCARFALDVMPLLDSAYVRTGKVQWIFVHLPLPGHSRAWLAAEAASCAGAVAGRFWALHDRLFERQAEWSVAADPHALFRAYAREAGVAAEPFDRCLTEDRVAPLIVQDILFAAATGIDGTPAFIVDREELVVGMKSFEEWRAILEKALQKKQKKP